MAAIEIYVFRLKGLRLSQLRAGNNTVLVCDLLDGICTVGILSFHGKLISNLGYDNLCDIYWPSALMNVTMSYVCFGWCNVS